MFSEGVLDTEWPSRGVGALGLAVSAIRFYEDRQLITSDRTGRGQRRFRRDVLRRLAFIQAAQRVGSPWTRSGRPWPASYRRRPVGPEWRPYRLLRPLLEERIALLAPRRDQLDHCIGSSFASTVPAQQPRRRPPASGPGPLPAGDRPPAERLEKWAGDAARPLRGGGS